MKHGTKTRRSWRKLHIGLDADTGQIVVATLTAKRSTTIPRLVSCSIKLRIPMIAATCSDRSQPGIPTIPVG